MLKIRCLIVNLAVGSIKRIERIYQKISRRFQIEKLEYIENWSKLYRRIVFRLISATIVNLVVGSIKRIEKIYQEISRRFEIRIFRKLMEKSSSYRRIYAKNNLMFDYKSTS